MKRINDLNAFLDIHNCREQYYSNFSENNHQSFIDFLSNEWLLEVEYIGSAFLWDQTPEGDDFWSDISMKWKEYLDNIEKLMGR